jgi:AcrR family transcriptional regulator
MYTAVRFDEGESSMATPVRGTSTRAAQAERTRQQILETARRLFAEHGYDATSLQMIADEMGLTKAAVYYHFPAKVDIRHALLQPRIEQLRTLNDEAAAIRGRRARVEFLVNGYVDFFVESRKYAFTSTDPAAKREKLDQEPESMARRALELIFGDNPTATQRLAFMCVTVIPGSLPKLADLPDEELRKALRTTMLHIFRVPA